VAFIRHVICSNYHENTMPETAFLGAQIAPKSLSAGASPQTPLGELSWIQGALLLRGGDGRGRGGPRKIVHPVKFLRIGPGLKTNSPLSNDLEGHSHS